jgi:hypothetical protein
MGNTAQSTNQTVSRCKRQTPPIQSGVAFAQAGGGNGNGGNSGNGGSGNGHGAATPAPTAGGDAASGAMSGGTKMQHTSKSKSTMKPKTKKPMADSTNGGASSDTNAQ